MQKKVDNFCRSVTLNKSRGQLVTNVKRSEECICALDSK